MITDVLHQYNIRAFPNLEPPVLVTPVVFGNPGATEYTYKATFTTIDGETTAGEEITATANASLTQNNRVFLQASKVPAGVHDIKFFKKVGSVFKYIGKCNAVANGIYDEGGTPTTEVPPTTNTSGRNQWKFTLIRPDRPLQRMDLMDMQGIQHKALRDLADTLSKNGDVKSGLSCSRTYPAWVFGTEYVEGTHVVTTLADVVAEYVCNTTHTAGVFSTDLTAVKWTLVSGAHWSFKAGVLYVDGLYIDIPAGNVTLIGTGIEKAGVLLSLDIVTYEDDVKLRNIDDGIPAEVYNVPGNDRLIITPSWTVDDDEQITVQEFIDGNRNILNIPTEQTELQKMLARQRFDTSGNFVVEPFPFKVIPHDTDEAKLKINVGRGVAYPNGYEIRKEDSQNLSFGKARITKSENNSSTGVFSIPGGYIISEKAETFAVDGLNIKLKVGSGSAITVTLSGNTSSASSLKTQIEAAVNAVPTTGVLVTCTASDGYLQIQAAPGKTLEIMSVASDAYTVIGFDIGINYPIGTRIYETNDSFIKTVSDLNYKTEIVRQVSHNGNTHKDLLPDENVVSILGAATTAVNCYDGNWDYTLNTDFARDGNYIDFSSYEGAEPGNGSTYYVKYTYRLTATKGIRELVRVVDAQITKGDIGTKDLLAFTSATSTTRVLGGRAVAGLSGNPTDVVRITAVNNSPAQGSSYYTDYVFDKNAGALKLEPSDLDWSGAGQPNTGETGQPAKNATYYVTYEFWYHSTEGDYVSADSYDNYEEIEYAPNAEWLLRDCIDFRTNGILPLDDEDVTLDYDFYLPRVDKLMLYPSGNLGIVTGTSSLHMPIPADQPLVLSLAVVYILPYTYTTNDVSIVDIQPMRTTQMGIRDYGHRIERLEYWDAVNGLEKEAQGHTLAVDSKGIFTDALTGWGRMDLSFDKGGITHTASLDRYNRCLLLPATTDPRQISIAHDECEGVMIPIRADGTDGDTIMLDYEPELIQEQPLASRWMNCASDFVYENYYGLMDISPSVDVFMDKNQLPQINVDFDGNLGALYNALNPVLANNANWGSWNNVGSPTDVWSGVSTLNTAFFPGTGNFGQAVMGGTRSQLQERSGTFSQIIPGSRTVDMGDRVVDLSLVQMVRTKNIDNSNFEIQVSITGLMPNIDHACTFGGVPVDLVYDNSPVNHHGEAGANTYAGIVVTQSRETNPDGSVTIMGLAAPHTFTTAKTSNDGNLTAKFVVPEGVAAGSIPIRVFYYADPDISTATTVFYSRGFTQNTQKTTVGLEDPKVITLPSTQTQVLTQEISWALPAAEPLAETFSIYDRVTYLSQAGLFFKSKHATLPITCQIRNVVNGYPGPIVHASSTLFPADVHISNDGSVETIFVFPNVIGYQPNQEYCFVTLPGLNNTGYEIFYCELGDIDLITGKRIVNQPASGVMFHGPNNTVWEPMTKSDIKYRLYKSNFVDNCAIVFSNITGVDASRFVTVVEDFVCPGTHATWSYSLDNGTTWTAYNPKIDVDLQSLITQVKLKINVTSLGGNYQVVWNMAGIVLMCHELEADCVFNNQFFTEPLNYPNKVAVYADVYAEGINGGGVTFITPYYSIDDGETWVEIEARDGHTPVITIDPYYRYEFETPEEASVTGATQATPIVITSAGHGFKDNAVITISGVEGNTNANGTYRVKNADENTFELVNKDTGADIVGNGQYTQNGTFMLTEFEQMRPRMYFATSNKARTPRVMNPVFICSRVEV